MCAYLQHDFDLGGTPMELQFNRKPCLILEATELLYVFVNQLSPRMLTADGPYCIPPAEVSAIMEEVCGSLSPEELTLHYYFQKYQLLEQSGATCLARLMVFSFVNLNESDPGLSFQALCDAWDRLRQGGYYFTSCSEYGLSMYAPRDSSTVPFAHGLWKLPLPHKTAGSPDEAGDGTARLCPGPLGGPGGTSDPSMGSHTTGSRPGAVLADSYADSNRLPPGQRHRFPPLFHAKSHPWLGG